MKLYESNRSDSGLTLIPKLKFEHLHLTNFSKMRVDLAAQVNTMFMVNGWVQNLNYSVIEICMCCPNIGVE